MMMWRLWKTRESRVTVAGKVVKTQLYEAQAMRGGAGHEEYLLREIGLRSSGG